MDDPSQMEIHDKESFGVPEPRAQGEYLILHFIDKTQFLNSFPKAVENTEETMAPDGEPEEQKLQQTKREKRRAKEAAKKAQGMENKGKEVRGHVTPYKSYLYISLYQRCNVCQEAFDSRTKLFNHLAETGHTLATSEGGKRNKKSAKAIKK